MWKMFALWTSKCLRSWVQSRGECPESSGCSSQHSWDLKRNSSDWPKLGEENNFPVQISALAQQVFSHLQTLSPLSLYFYKSFSACEANNSHDLAGIWKTGVMETCHTRKDETSPNRWFLWKASHVVSWVVPDFNNGHGLPDLIPKSRHFPYLIHYLPPNVLSFCDSHLSQWPHYIPSYSG